jgi:NADH:ubiquinone oxidoreductase subunit 2 (subunit N)
MYMREPEEELEFSPYSPTLVIGLIIAAIGVLLIGILPSLMLNPAQNSVF